LNYRGHQGHSLAIFLTWQNHHHQQDGSGRSQGRQLIQVHAYAITIDLFPPHNFPVSLVKRWACLTGVESISVRAMTVHQIAIDNYPTVTLPRSLFLLVFGAQRPCSPWWLGPPHGLQDAFKVTAKLEDCGAPKIPVTSQSTSRSPAAGHWHQDSRSVTVPVLPEPRAAAAGGPAPSLFTVTRDSEIDGFASD
jgi:hypothetical protein